MTMRIEATKMPSSTLYTFIMMLSMAYKSMAIPVDQPVSGTSNEVEMHNPAFSGRYKRSSESEYHDSSKKCVTTVPAALPSKGTERECNVIHNSSLYEEKTALDKCCKELDSQLQHEPYLCGPFGALKCFDDQDKPVCTCALGRTGLTCNETINDQVRCTCYSKLNPLAGKLRLEFVHCNSLDKGYDDSECFIETAGNICQCNKTEGEINETLPLCTDVRPLVHFNGSTDEASNPSESQSNLIAVVVPVVAAVAVIVVAITVCICRRKRTLCFKASTQYKGPEVEPMRTEDL